MITTSPRRRWATVALSAVAVVGLLLVAFVVVVRGVLLDPGTYRSALVEADAYERVYTEVFADPEMAAVKDELIGSLTFGVVDPTQVRAKLTATLRWTVPPSTLQRGTETLIDHTLAYVRGDVARLDGEVPVTDVLQRVERTAVADVRTSLAGAADRFVTTLDDYRTAVASLAEELAAGRVPSAVPVLGGASLDTDVTTAGVVEALLDALGTRVDDDARRRITAAVLAGDQRDGVIDAAGLLVTEHAARVADRLRTSITQTGGLDVVAVLAERSEQAAERVVGSLDRARDVASVADPWVAVVGGLLTVIGLAGLVIVRRDDPRRAAFAVATTIAVAGVVVGLAWLVAGALVEPPLASATDTGPGTWNLPANLRALVADIRDEVGADVASTVWRIVLVLVGAGAVTALVLALTPRASGATAWRWVAGAGLVAVGAATVAGVAAANVGTDGARACNGHPELCDRAYDEVVYAATHNSMSSPDVVSVWPEHDGNIRAQLDAGVRALLIDAKYWTTVRSAQALAEAEPLLPPVVAAAVFPTLGDRATGRDGTFLCHIHCAFGEIDFTEAMVGVREFLDENPDEVVTFVLQDEITPSDTEQVMAASGLEPYLFTYDGGDWPTLGEMIDRGERLVVLAENQGPPPAWHHDGFDLMQETPFLFREPEDMSCEPNRGNPEASLFQMNHWVQRAAPDRVDAVIVNDHDFIVERALRCQAERGLLPNFVAVNFYNIGDLMAAVDTLNGV